MSIELPDVIIRKARPEDFDDLNEMGDVYWGKDYLADEYHTYIKDPNIYPLVAEVKGKAIGFYMNQILDDGLTLIKRAGRVHPKFRGHGIFHLLSDELDKHRKEFYPNVKYETFGTTNKGFRAAKEFEEKGFVEVIRKRIVNMHVKIQNIKGLENQDVSQHVTTMTYDDLRLLMSNNKLVERLIPKNVFFNWFVGYRMFESNIKYIINEKAFVIASTSSSTIWDVKAQGSNKSTPETIDKIDILSCAHKHIGVYGLSHQIDIYTADGYDESMIKKHLIAHYKNFLKSTTNDGITMVTFNSNVKEELIFSHLKDIGIVDLIKEMEVLIGFFEKKL